MALRMHSRTQVVSKAENDLRNAILEWIVSDTARELTTIEVASILERVLSDNVRTQIRMLLRIERHGTPDKKADEA